MVPTTHHHVLMHQSPFLMVGAWPNLNDARTTCSELCRWDLPCAQNLGDRQTQLGTLIRMETHTWPVPH